MKERKTIAMCISGTMRGAHDDMITGAFEYCKSKGIRLLLYKSLLLESDYDIHSKDNIMNGEYMPFQLVDFDKISGLIIAGGSIVSEDVKKELVRRARMKNLPVVSIEDENTTGCFRVNVDDEEGMAQIVSHVVEEHGLTKVNFMGGIPGNRESENRLRAYKKVLEKNHIPVEESRIGYGGFGPDTEKVLEKFFDGTHEKPQAIICANDAMAIRTVCFLTERGYTVPNDVVVTGFDGSEEASTFCPVITTARRGMKEAGEEAVKVLIRIWKDKAVALDTSVTPGMVYGQSCGCQPVYPKQVISLYKYQKAEIAKNRDFFKTISSLMHFAATQRDVDSYLSNLEYSVKDFKIKSMMFCLADKPFSHKAAEGETFAPYPEKLRIAGAFGIAGMKDRYIKSGEIPQEILDSEDITCISFVPIYFVSNTLGYLMMCHDSIEFDRDFLKKWLGVVSSQLGVIYDNLKV